MRKGDLFDFDVYLSFHNYNQFFSKGKILDKEPVWSEKSLIYDYSPINNKELNLTIPVNENIRKNRTLYLHMQFKTMNPFYVKGVNDKDYGYTYQREDINEDGTPNKKLMIENRLRAKV